MSDDKRKERGLNELYAEDPERADALVFGRRPNTDRRGFLKGAGLMAMAAAVGAHLPFHRNYPAGLIPAALAEGTGGFVLEGKDGLVILSDRPINAETPAHLLDVKSMGVCITASVPPARQPSKTPKSGPCWPTACPSPMP